MKSTLKIFLVLALFCGTAMAEGDMGAGGLWDGQDATMTTSNADGDMGAGGKTCPNGQTTCLVDTPADEEFSLIKFISQFLY